ncbi:ATP-binding cassette domain-containing protein [Mollicutes bacterium LVI A0039]|nr:ATP-binding cassette domain-containing protein [Mollicutes bacterium LVI A0039]
MNLKLDNVFYKYKEGEKTVLNGISFEMHTNKLGLIGSSGSGKSTLVHLLNGMKVPYHGEIMIDEQLINKNSKPRDLQNIRMDVAIVYQFTDLQLFAETVRKELVFACDNFGIVKENIDEEIEMYFEKFNLDLDCLKSSPFSLSGGQKKKVAIITMLLIEPKLLILDEPTVGLDPQSVTDILQAIDELAQNGLKVIMICHDMNSVYQFCDHILELHAGMKIFDGTKYDYFKLKYAKKQLLLLPSHLAYAASIDSENVLYDKLYNGGNLADYIQERHV